MIPASPATFSAADADAYRALARRWAATVNVVTVCRDQRPDGFTATAVLMVSIDPPIVLVSATKGSSPGEMLSEVERFAVNLLGESQREVAEWFATPHEQREGAWSGFGEGLSAGDPPLIPDTLGAFSASVRERIDAGDHLLVLGDVTAIHLGADAPPLLYANREYARVSGGEAP